jgi:ketosteroid isomerase-like protein
MDDWVRSWRCRDADLVPLDSVQLVRRLYDEGGLPSERETAHVWSVRDGRLVAIQVFRDRADAVAAVGL